MKVYVPSSGSSALVLLIATIGASSGWGATGSLRFEGPESGHARSLTVTQSAGPVIVDGNLDDAAWSTATMADSFWISAQGRAPAEMTEVLVLANARNLYVAFRCYESQPERLAARQTRRDANLGYDDQVAVELDPFHNHRDVSTYALNLRGTQSDSIASGRADKIEWKGDWLGATSKTEYGWSAEFEIPFEILNYAPGNSEFGVNFLRYHHRTKELSRWADVTPQHKPEEMGQLTSLQLPAAGKDKTLTLMPYAFAGDNVPNQRGSNPKSRFAGGIDIRFEPRSDVTALLTYNPDFRQVETQVTDIDFSYNEKFRRDPRTFFQEGSAYFGDDEYFYTNRIPDFDYGGKTFGRLGRNKLGLLATSAADDRRDLALRAVHEFTPTDSVGMMIVATDRQELTNQLAVLEVDGRRRTGLNYELDIATTRTDYEGLPGDQKGEAVDGSLAWQSDHWSIGSDFSRYDADYFPANGLFEQDTIGTEGIRPYVSYFRDFGNRGVREVTGYVTRSHRDTLDGQPQTRNWSAGATLETRKQIRIGAFHSAGDYRPLADGPGEFADEVLNDHFWTFSLDFNTRSDLFAYGLTHSHGSLGGGDYENTFAYAWYRPIDRMFINLSTEHLESFGTFDQTMVSAGWELTDQDGLVARYIWADEGDYVRVAYRRRVRSGIDIFAVLDNEPLFDARASLKVVWTW